MILNIPEELLLKIFRYLTTQDLLQNVALVNRKFRKISNDSDLLRIIVLKDIDEYVYQQVENLLRKATRLQKLTVKRNVLNHENLIKVALKTSKDLKCLEITGNISEDFSLSLSEHGRNLKHLELLFPTEITNADIWEDFVESMKERLRSLRLNLNTGYPDFFGWNFNSLRHLQFLTKLDLVIARKALNDDQIENLARIPNLKEFILTGYASSLMEYSGSLIKLVSKLNMEHLENLEIKLRCSHYLPVIFEVLIGRLGPNLQKLQLGCEVDDCSEWCQEVRPPLDMDQIKTILMKCPNLKQLKISGKQLSERFLCEVEYKYNLKLIVDLYKRKSMRRYKIFNPRFNESLVYF